MHSKSIIFTKKCMLLGETEEGKRKTKNDESDGQVCRKLKSYAFIVKAVVDGFDLLILSMMNLSEEKTKRTNSRQRDLNIERSASFLVRVEIIYCRICLMHLEWQKVKLVLLILQFNRQHVKYVLSIDFHKVACLRLTAEYLTDGA